MRLQQWVSSLALASLAISVSAQPPSGGQGSTNPAAVSGLYGTEIPGPGPSSALAGGPPGAIPAQYAALAASGQSIPPQYAALAASGQSIPPQYAALAASGQSIPPQFAQLAAIVSAMQAGVPGQAPMPTIMAPTSSQGGGGGSTSVAYNPIPLAPYIEMYSLQLPEEFLLLQQVFRFVGTGLTPVNDRLRAAVQQSFQGFLSAGSTLNIRFQLTDIRESEPAPSVYSGGQQPPIAPAPSPATTQQAPAPGPSGGRRLLQTPSPPITADPTAYASVDATIETYAHPNSTFLEVNQPSQLLGFIAVNMLQAGYQVQMLALGYKYGPDAVPLVKKLPLRPLYILESVIEVGKDIAPSPPPSPNANGTSWNQFESPGFDAFTLGEQNQVLLAANSLLASQQAFAWNVIVRNWISPPQSRVRTVLKSYVTQNLSSIDQVLGGNFGVLLQEKANAAGAPVNLTLVSSVQVGTLTDELNGKLVDVDPAPSAEELTVTRRDASGGGLGPGAIAGIVVGGVAAVTIVAVIAGLLVMRRRKRLQNPFAADSQKRGGWPFGQREKRGKGSEKAAELGSSPGDVSASQAQGGLSGSGYISVPLSESLVVSKAHKVSPEVSSGTEGESSGLTTHNSEADSVKEMFLQKEVWNIDPSELQVYKLPDGRDWLLGTGSFGQVFRGIRSGVQDVAIKRLLQPDVLHLRLFQREIALLRLLNYDRNIVQFYGACLAEGNLMLVCEFMEGGDLRDALGDDDSGALDWYNGGATLLMDIARGLHFLHINQVVHRDLKTKNILLTAGNKAAKIGDIGLAKLMGSHLMSSTAQTAGTFAYAAPELLMGDTCDEKADIYSFGVVIWELVTHEVPIRGALRHVKVPEECPQEVADIIDSCLLSNPQERPSAKEVFDALRAIVSPATAPSAPLAQDPLPEVVQRMPTS